MKCVHIQARDLPDAWFQCVDACYKEGRDYKITEGSYAGQVRREFDYVTIHVTHPGVRPLLPEIPKHFGLPDPVPTGMEYVEEYLPYIMTPEIKEGEQYTYGSRLFSEISCFSPGHCQVEEIVAKFKRGFGNNQACMTIAQPSDIHLADPPCLRQIDCRVYPQDEPKQLHFVIYFRSWDLWAGFPPNLAAIRLLQEHMADLIGIEAGEMICSSKGLHLYDHFWELARIRLGE